MYFFQLNSFSGQFYCYWSSARLRLVKSEQEECHSTRKMLMLCSPKNVIGHFCYNRNLLMTANKNYLNKRPLLMFARRKVCYYSCQHWQFTNWDNCFIYKKRV